MTQSDDDKIQVHGGHHLEAGLLERVREWTDLFPWWRLIRTLRIVASPTMLFVTTVTYGIWMLGMTIGVANVSGIRLDEAPRILLRGPSLVALLWSILVWAPTAILLTRQGGLLTAGRTLVGFRDGISLGVKRSWRGWSSALMPLVAALLIGLLMVPLAWISGGERPHTEVAVAVGFLSAIIAIPCGIIAFGGLIAVPLSWAALGNEQDSDPLNALSRGYEAFFRRPLHLAFYLFVGWLILWVIDQFAEGVALAAINTATLMLGLGGSSPRVAAATANFISGFPTIVSITLGFGLIGGIYLLLRYDTGGQEVEDIWQQQPSPTPPLPQLPNR